MPEVEFLGQNGFRLCYSNLGVKRTQDWKLCHAVFNSLENTEVKVYLGCWGAKTGTVEWRHPKLEEIGLVNLVRRAGAPFEVKTEDGRVLSEGKDFEPVSDPRLGMVPYRGASTMSTTSRHSFTLRYPMAPASEFPTTTP